MKSINYILTLVGVLALGAGCDKMNDIQEKYTSQEERVYLGKVNPLRSSPGLGRAKIVWSNGTDPRIESTVVYWNDRADSIVKPLSRTSLGVQEDSVLVENLREGNHLFEFRTTNKRGESSLFTSMSVTVWGTNFVNSELVPRSVFDNSYDFPSSRFTLTLSACDPGDNVVYTLIEYLDKSGNKRSVKVDRDAASVTLEDFPDGGEVSLSSAFFIGSGLDSLYSEAVSLKAPEALRVSGQKLDIGDGFQSKYYNRAGELYEWTSEGSFRIWKESDGTFSLSQTTDVMAYRSTFREFFFYDDDRFITVTHAGGNLSMFQMNVTPEGASLALVKENFGGGFTFDHFIVVNGFFFSLNSIAGGSLLWWPVDNNGNWASGLGASRSSSFHYPLFTVWQKEYLIVADSEGALWSIQVGADGILGTTKRIGQGWDKFASLIAVGEHLLAQDSSGAFYQFDFDLDHYWIAQ